MALKEDLKKYVDLGVSASKDALSKAGAAVSKFGDESVVRLEKLQLEKQLAQEISALGEQVYQRYADGSAEFPLTGDATERLEKIKGLKAEIARRDELLKKKPDAAKPAPEQGAPAAEPPADATAEQPAESAVEEKPE